MVRLTQAAQLMEERLRELGLPLRPRRRTPEERRANSNHVRWHTRRGVTSPTCCLCSH
jgi:hypothetical protein